MYAPTTAFPLLKSAPKDSIKKKWDKYHKSLAMPFQRPTPTRNKIFNALGQWTKKRRPVLGTRP